MIVIPQRFSQHFRTFVFHLSIVHRGWVFRWFHLDSIGGWGFINGIIVDCDKSKISENSFKVDHTSGGKIANLNK